MPVNKFFREDIKCRIETYKAIKDFKNKHSNILKKSKADRASGDGLKEPYKNMTFLYIRATETDDGTRPIEGTTWLSPDVNVYPNTGGQEICWGIQAGQQYTINIIVRNDGDTDVPAGTVDIRLANPSVGWTVSDTKLLGIINVSIPAFSSKVVTFEWTANFEDVGHRCLFARVYSISPLDVPNDWESLSTCQDRHIGQQNLSIVEEESEINVDATGENEGAGDQKGKFKLLVRPAKDIPQKLNLIDGLTKVSLKKGSTKTIFSIAPRKKINNMPIGDISIKRLTAANTWLGKVSGRVGAKLLLNIPKLSLRKNEGAVYDVVSIDLKSNKEIGGFTLVVIKRKKI